MRTLVEVAAARWRGRRARVVIWVVVAALIVAFTLAWSKVVDEGVDRLPDAAPVTDTEIRLASSRSIDPILIDPKVIGQRLAHRFAAGELGNSRGVTLPPRVRRMIEAEVDTRAERRRSWWRRSLNAGACVVNMQVAPLTWTCVTHRQWDNDRQYAWWKRVEKIKLTCGGAAVFGYVSGSWKGAAIGGASCAFTQAVSLW